MSFALCVIQMSLSTLRFPFGVNETSLSSCSYPPDMQSGTRLLSIKCANRTKIVIWGLADETEKKKKGGWKKNVTFHISPPCGHAISQPLSTKFGDFIDLTGVVTPAAFGFRIFIGFSRPRGGKKHFPIYKSKRYK